MCLSYDPQGAFGWALVEAPIKTAGDGTEFRAFLRASESQGPRQSRAGWQAELGWRWHRAQDWQMAAGLLPAYLHVTHWLGQRVGLGLPRSLGSGCSGQRGR